MKKPNKKTLIAGGAVALIITAAIAFVSIKSIKEPETELICGKPPMVPQLLSISDPSQVRDFDSCVAFGMVPTDSFPWRICKLPDGTEFKETLTDKDPISGTEPIRTTSLRANDKVEFPFVVEGEAHEAWFSYGGFPVKLALHNGNGMDDYEVLYSTIACPNGEKDSEGMIPFKVLLEKPQQWPPSSDGQLYISLVRTDPKETEHRRIIHSVPISIDK